LGRSRAGMNLLQMPNIVAASSGVFLGCVGIEIWPGADDIDWRGFGE